MSSLRDVIRQHDNNTKAERDRNSDMQVTLVAIDYAESTKVRNRPGYKWGALYANPRYVFQIFAPNVKDRVGLPIHVARSRKAPFMRRIATGVDWNRVSDDALTELDGVDPHAPTHEWPDGAPGADALAIYPRAITPLSMRLSSGLWLYITPGVYRYRGKSIKFTGQLVDLTSHVPTAGTTVRLSIYINPETNTVGVEATSAIASIQSPPYELVSKNVLYVGWVRLNDTSTAITESVLAEPRAFMAVDAVGFETILDADANSAALLAESVEGEAYWATDTEILYVFDGSTHKPIAGSSNMAISAGVLKNQVFS